MKNTIIAASLTLALPGIAFAQNPGVVSTGGPAVVQAEPIVVAPEDEPVVTEAAGTSVLPPYLPAVLAGAAVVGAAALVLGSIEERGSSSATTTTTTAN